MTPPQTNRTSIDYDRLRSLVVEMEQGVAATTRYTWLDLAHELLELREGAEKALRVLSQPGSNTGLHARIVLTRLLNGDNE